MKRKRDIPTLLISAVIMVVAATTFISYSLFSRTTDAVEAGQFATMEAILNNSLRGAEGRALASAQLVADLPSTKAAFAGRDAAARERLLTEYRHMFEVQRDKYGVDQMQFHVPPAVSFLRLQAPTNFGDDLSAFRPLVVAVNRDQIARQGGAIARTGPAIFGVVPVFDAGGQPLGSFEVGIDYGTVLDGLKADFGFESALFIAEDPLRRFGSPEITAPLLNENNRVGKYVKTQATHWDLLKTLVSSGDVATLNETKRYTRSSNNNPYGLVLAPIRNFAGETMGLIAVAKDFSTSRAASGQLLVVQSLLAVFSVVLLAGVIMIVVRGMLLEPLAELQMLSAQREAAKDDES
ncbi:MAG: hypothetical protein NTZ05_20455 [Chloroflexi bacterium]|nr:hypothetical protein [Chloroflexota bacterium]